MAQEAVEVVLLSDLIPFPVRRLEMPKQHRRLGVALGIVTPHIHIPLRAALGCPSRPLKPGVKTAGVIEHQVKDHLDPVLVGGG